MKELKALSEVTLAPPEVEATKAEVLIRQLEEQAAGHKLEAESLAVQEPDGWRERYRIRKQIRHRVMVARNAARGAKRIREIRDSLIVAHGLQWTGQQWQRPQPGKADVPAQA